jgi:hypothetical protein
MVMDTKQSLRVFLGCVLFCILSALATAQPVLTIEGSCPGLMRAQVDNARPRKGIVLLYSPRTGSFRLPWYYWCAGTELGLHPRGIRIVADTVADENGHATFDGFVSSGACGGFLQTLNSPSGNCETSNVIRIP